MHGRDQDFEHLGELLLKRSDRQTSGLSQQIAILLRYLIATKAVEPGASLPPLREGAKALGVNLHTLRSAYRLLQEQGYLEIIPSVGVRIAPGPRRNFDEATPGALDRFLDDVIVQARRRFGLNGAELAGLINARAKGISALNVNFVECTQGQARMHADQVEKLLGRHCAAVVIAPDSPAPHGFSITTLFHLDEIEQAWPGAAPSFNYVHIDVATTIRAAVASAQNYARIVICEYDAPLGQKIMRRVAEISGAPARRLGMRETPRAGDPTAVFDGDCFFLVAPRVWNRLPCEITARANVRQIEYDIDPEDARDLRQKYARARAANEQSAMYEQ